MITEVASTRLPQEAIQLTEGFEPDLAILDIRMPKWMDLN